MVPDVYKVIQLGPGFAPSTDGGILFKPKIVRIAETCETGPDDGSDREIVNNVSIEIDRTLALTRNLHRARKRLKRDSDDAITT